MLVCDCFHQVIAKLSRQYIHDLLPNMHAEQFGLTREAAELEFLKVKHISLFLHPIPPPLTPHMPCPLTGGPETARVWECVLPSCQGVCVSDVSNALIWYIMVEDDPIASFFQDKHGAEGEVWLGFCVRGIVVYNVHKEVKTPIHHCPWKKTKNISFAVSDWRARAVCI